MRYRYPDSRIQVFARAPLPGKVKTRLHPVLDPGEAARVHADMVRRTLGMAIEAALAPVELWCAPSSADPFLVRCAVDYGAELFNQRGADLGERMHAAAQSAHVRGHAALIIGCDCPVLDAAYLERALRELQDGRDVVLGPAEDGGYVLIAIRQPHTLLFRDIPWGSSTVLECTRERLRALRLDWRELALLWDVDRPADLARWKTACGMEWGQKALNR